VKQSAHDYIMGTQIAFGPGVKLAIELLITGRKAMYHTLSRYFPKQLLFGLLLVLLACEETPGEQKLPEVFNLAPRADSALAGHALAVSLQTLDLQARETEIFKAIDQGNIPAFMRHPIPVSFEDTLAGVPYMVTISVLPDYLCLGSDEDYFLMPMTPILAQRVMDRIGGILPTRKMVALIWKAASVKLEPAPIPPSAAMVTMVVFDQHNNMVHYYRDAELELHPLGELVAGHKKDVILSNEIATNPRKVVIYGWQYPDGTVIQQLYTGHVNWYADYSHGVRVVAAQCVVNDSAMLVADVLQDPLLYRLLSDEEGPMEQTCYDTAAINYP